MGWALKGSGRDGWYGGQVLDYAVGALPVSSCVCAVEELSDVCGVGEDGGGEALLFYGFTFLQEGWGGQVLSYAVRALPT